MMKPKFPIFLEKQVANIKNENNFRQGIFRFGSLTILVNYTLEYYKEFIEELYRTWMEDCPEDTSAVKIDAELFIFQSPVAFSPKYHHKDNPYFYYNKEEDWYQVRSDYVDAYIETSTNPIRIYVPINPEGKPKEPLLNFLLGVFNRILFILGRLHIHASSITVGDTTSMFVGEKGAGKSTISIFLAKSGATIWGEDHTMLNRKESKFFVSGCDGIMRLTKKTETHFFKQELHIVPQLFDGVLKKQIVLGDYFDSRPYQDVEVHNLFFPFVGNKFHVKKMSGKKAILYFLERIQPRNRFANSSDMHSIIDYLGDFLNSVRIYSLELDPDLNKLYLLNKFLESQNEIERQR